jgi:hypothetical protein
MKNTRGDEKKRVRKKVKRITNAKMSLRGEDEKLSMLQDTSIRE